MTAKDINTGNQQLDNLRKKVVVNFWIMVVYPITSTIWWMVATMWNEPWQVAFAVIFTIIGVIWLLALRSAFVRYANFAASLVPKPNS